MAIEGLWPWFLDFSGGVALVVTWVESEVNVRGGVEMEAGWATTGCWRIYSMWEMGGELFQLGGIVGRVRYR